MGVSDDITTLLKVTYLTDKEWDYRGWPCIQSAVRYANCCEHSGKLFGSFRFLFFFSTRVTALTRCLHSESTAPIGYPPLPLSFFLLNIDIEKLKVEETEERKSEKLHGTSCEASPLQAGTMAWTLVFKHGNVLSTGHHPAPDFIYFKYIGQGRVYFMT